MRRAPRGIKYRRISSRSSLHGAVEMDYVSLTPKTTIPNHIHEHADTLCFVISGNGFLRTGNKRFRIRAGQIINIPAGAWHEFSAGMHRLVFVSVQHPPIANDYVFA
jgi:quercetin dioxygenase-like cupin family protein